MTETWKVINEATAAEEPDVHDIQVVDAVNRFARMAKITILDYDGVKAINYPKGTAVTVKVTPKGVPEFTRFGGFVADVLREERFTIIVLFSYDLWLRRRDVMRNYEDMTLSAILKDLITTLTPLDWDAAKVNVQNDQVISRRWKGEKIDAAIDEIASISGNENFGADDTGTFFFRPRTDTTAPIEFLEPRYTHIEFDDEGRREINQIKVYFGQSPNTGAIIEFDPERQQDLADRLGRPRPVVVEDQTAFPEITFDPSVAGSKQAAEDAARRKGRKILDGKTGILKGSMITWGGFDVNAGEIVFVQAPQHNISGEFRIAEIEFNYLSGDTRVKLAENTEGVIDTLVAMSQEVARIDLRAADDEVVPTQYARLTNPVDLTVGLKVWKVSIPDDMFVWGESYGGWGDPSIGGGKWGDSRPPAELIVEVIN